MTRRSWVRAPHGTHADLAQVAFGQTQAFHLWTWIERTAFNREVPGSSPGIGTRHIAQLAERKTFNLVVMGSSPICDIKSSFEAIG